MLYKFRALIQYVSSFTLGVTFVFAVVFYQSYVKHENYSLVTTGVAERRQPIITLQKLKRIENESKKCEGCSRNVPNVIIQYGPGRTGTTLQFQILCLMMAMLHEDEVDSVGCYFHKKSKMKKYHVVKTHSIESFIIPNSWVFLTSKTPFISFKLGDKVKKMLKGKNITIPYKADINMVTKRGYFIAYDYQSIFGLSNETMEQVIEYFRYWDILRLCCGMQMSADWRNHLSPKDHYKLHHHPHHPTYPACEMYNKGQVELIFINTYAYKKFAHIDSLRRGTGSLSDVDGKLNGSYCARCNKNVARKHLAFNQRCDLN